MRHDMCAVAIAAVLPFTSVSRGLGQQPGSASLSGLMRDVACAPVSPATKPSSTIKVVSGRDAARTLFGTGDGVVVSAGTAQGVNTGDEFFARRVVGDQFTATTPGSKPAISIHTGGMVRIVEAQQNASIGIVTYGCDGILKGDYLERFVPPSLPPGTTSGTPDFEHPARLVMGDDRRQTASPGEFMVIDRGSDHGLRPGQQVTIFRRTLPDRTAPVATIGTATVYAVRPETAIVRVDKSTDAVYVGDLVAIHR